MADSAGKTLDSGKWQLALAVGVPVAVGVGYWYYRSYKTGDSPDKYDQTPKTPSKLEHGESLQHSASADTVKPKVNISVCSD